MGGQPCGEFEALQKSTRLNAAWCRGEASWRRFDMPAADSWGPTQATMTV